MARVNENIRYEPDDPCPPLVSIGVALQGVLIALANTVLFVTVAFTAVDLEEGYLSWAVFAALVIGGVVTALQANRAGRLGAGHVLMTGAGPHFIAVSVLALTAGGPSMLTGLLVLSSLVQFALAAWLPLLRRIITPVVSGTALMLIAVTVMTIAIKRVSDVPEDAPPGAGPIAALVTLAVAAMLAIRASGVWKLWATLIGLASGTVVAALFGLYDPQMVMDAGWFFVPDIALWPGFDLRPGPEFWTLLPAFLIVSLVVAIKMSVDGVVLQQVSRRRPPATDFRLVQGAVNVNGLGALLAGITGALPTIVYAPSIVSLVTITGVAARSVGFAIGAMLILLAFLPKVAGILLTVPGPVMGGFLLMVMGLLFVEGMRMVFQDGLDPQKAIVVGLSLSLGVGLQSHNVLEDVLGTTLGASLGNGMAVGVMTAIVLTSFIELSSPRRVRLETTLETSALPEIDAFLRELASKMRWNDASTERLRAAGEETLSSLLQSGGDLEADNAPRLIIVARPGRTVELEFMAVFDEENLEDRLAYLNEQSEIPEEHEVSFWLLRHYASSVRHRKYHGVDIVTVEVET